MSLTRVEQETIILYNQEDKTAVCTTCDPSLKRKLDDLCEKSVEITKKTLSDDCEEYTFPRSWVKIKMPRQLTDEQRERLAEQMERVRNGKKGDNT